MIAMILIGRLIGFHVLLLPTFVLGFSRSLTCCRRGPDAWRSWSHSGSVNRAVFRHRPNPGPVIDV